jgi:Predicted ATPase
MVFLRQVSIPSPQREQQGKFPFSLALFRDGLEIEFNNAVTVFAGENASGKSTLLESLGVKCGFAHQGGYYGHTIRKTVGTNGFGEAIERDFDNLSLADNMRLVWNRRHHAGFFLRAEYMSETLAQYVTAEAYLSCSHGEGLLEVIKDKFKEGLFILDEPETALSPTSQLALLSLIHENSKRFNAQYIIVTHSPILMAIPESDFFWIGDGKLTKMDYRQSTPFIVTKAFCNNPDKMIAQVNAEENGERPQNMCL